MSSKELYNLITFNVFCNCTVNSPSIFPLDIFFESFIDSFELSPELMKINVFIDSHPIEKNYEEYSKNIKQYLISKKANPKIHKTVSLVDGWNKSLQICETKFQFNLEHDFALYKRNITHNLIDILKAIEDDNDIVLCRFSHQNLRINKYEKYLDPIILNTIKFLKTPNVGNYAQIIKTNTYIDKFLPLLDLNAVKSYGIEAKLTGQNGCIVYPGKNNLRTWQHIHGRIKNGFEAINNMFPGECCNKCNLSKADHYDCINGGTH